MLKVLFLVFMLLFLSCHLSTFLLLLYSFIYLTPKVWGHHMITRLPPSFPPYVHHYFQFVTVDTFFLLVSYKKVKNTRIVYRIAISLERIYILAAMRRGGQCFWDKNKLRTLLTCMYFKITNTPM